MRRLRNRIQQVGIKDCQKYERDEFMLLIANVPSVLYRDYLRRYLPTDLSLVEYNGVESIVKVGHFDSYVPGYEQPWDTENVPEYEHDEMNGLK